MVIRKPRGLDALTSLAADRMRLLEDMQPAIELARKHAEMMRPLLESARRYEEAMHPLVEAARRHEEATRPLLDAARRHEEAMRPFVEPVQRHQDTFRHVTDALQFNAPALEFASQLRAPQIEIAERLGNAVALSDVVDEAKRISKLTERWRATFNGFGDLTKLLPTSAFADMQRIAESVRRSMPEFPALDSTLLGSTLSADLADAVERLRERAESVANDPDAGVEDVEDLVAEAQAINAASPVEARSRVNGYLLVLFFWLLDKAAEDPTKELIHNAVAALILVLTTVAPPAAPPRPALPVPEVSVPTEPPSGGALIAPGGWQAEGLPEIIRRAGPEAERLTLEFFNESIHSANTRQAYEKAVMRFTDWCDDRDLELTDITPFVVRAYIKQMQREYAAATVKQHLAAIRLLFDHLVLGGLLPMNPADGVRAPRLGTRKKGTAALQPEEATTLLDAIDASDGSGLRDRALLSAMFHSRARVSAVVAMDVKDYVRDGGQKRLRLLERGGAPREVPVHQTADECLDSYLEAAGIGGEPESPLWRTMTKGRGFSDRRMSRVDVFRMIRRRMKDAGLGKVADNVPGRARTTTARVEASGGIAVSDTAKTWAD